MSAFFDHVDDFFINYANHPSGIVFEVFCVIYCFFALAIVCDNYLAPALETLCIRWGVREDVAGATFLAFGSAAPEIVINAVTTIKSQVTTSNTTSLGVSAIIGSGMLAFSFIPAMCCFASEIQLKLKRRPLLRDEAFYLIALFTLCAAFHDGKIVFLESVFLILIYFAHLATVITSPWVRKTYRHKVKGIKLKKTSKDSFVHQARAQLERQRSLKKAKSLGHILPASAPVTPTHPDPIPKPGLLRAISVNSMLSNQNGTIFVQTKASHSQLAAYGIQEHNTELSEDDVDLGIDSMAPAASDCQNKSGMLVRTDKFADTMEERLLVKEDKINIIRQITGESNSSLNTINTSDTDFYPNVSVGSDDSDEESKALIQIFMYWITIPLRILFGLTCPPAGEGESCERLYGVTFFISVVHVAIFSFILSSVIGAWVTAWGMPQALFGMLLIAIGAEIPDTIESVTMARKLYGSMAVSNCQGTQVINIGIGLGLPWLLTNLTGHHVVVCGHDLLQISALFQTGIVCSNFFLLVGLALIQRKNKALLAKWKAVLLLVLYVMALLGFTLYLYFSHNLFKDTCS